MGWVHPAGIPVEEVRKMPTGSVIYLNGYDRFGIRWWLKCTVTNEGKTHLLSYRDERGLTQVERIRKNPARWFSITEGGLT